MNCKLKEVLGERGMSQSFLAKKMGMHRQVVYSWAANKVFPAIDVAVSVAEFLGEEVTDIWVSNKKEEKQL